MGLGKGNPICDVQYVPSYAASPQLARSLSVPPELDSQ